VHDDRQGVHLIPVDEDIQLHHVGSPVFLKFVIQGGVAPGHGFELIEKVHHHFRHGHVVLQLHLAAVVSHIHLIAPFGVAQGDDGPHVILGHENGGGNDGFPDFLDLGNFRKLGRIFHLDEGAVPQYHLIDHRGSGGNQVLVEFPLQALLHDFHVQEPEEATAEAEPQGLGDFRFKLQGGVVELELFQGFPQGVVLVGFHRIESGENLGFDFFETGQRRGSGTIRQGDRIPHLGSG